MPTQPIPRVVRRPRRLRRRSERGVALILVLGALTVLAVMLTEVQDEASSELGAAVAERDAVKAEYAARSAVNLARLLIAAEPTVSKQLGMLAMMFGGSMPQLPIWEHSGMILGAFNDKESAKGFSTLIGADAEEGKNLGMPGASFELTVVDEASKINVNLAARPNAASKKQIGDQLLSLIRGVQYDDLFEEKDENGDNLQRGTICSSLIDWADYDSDTETCGAETAQGSGAEDTYYDRLEPPYQRKNAAYDSLDELRMVRGVGEDFWNTFVDPDPDDPSRRILTVWGEPKINVNTASCETLLRAVCTYADINQPPPLCGGDLEQVTKFLMACNMMKAMAKGMPFFGGGKSFVQAVTGKSNNPMAKMMMDGLGIQPIKLAQPQLAEQAFSAKSQIFSIYATGKVKSGKRESQVRIHAVVDFRNAPEPALAMAGLDPRTGQPLAGMGANGATAPVPTATGTSGTGSDSSPDAILAALKASPAGQIIYYRVD